MAMISAMIFKKKMKGLGQEVQPKDQGVILFATSCCNETGSKFTCLKVYEELAVNSNPSDREEG